MPILDIDIDVAKKVYDVNVFGVIRTTQAFSSLVIAAEGTIVIIGSIAGIMPYVFGGSFPLYLLPLMSRRVQLVQSGNTIHCRHPPRRNVPLQSQSPQHCHGWSQNFSFGKIYRHVRSSSSFHLGIRANRGVFQETTGIQ